MTPSAPARRPPRSERDLQLLRGLAQRIDPGDAGAHNNLGVLYFNKGMYEEAVAAFQSALAIDARMEVARRNLEIVYHATGHYETLIAELTERLVQDPEDTEARRRLAQAYLDSGQGSLAVAELRYLLSRAPDDLQTLIGLGQAEKAAGNLPAAIAWFRQALALDPQSAVLHFWVGELLYNTGQSGEARAALLRAIELNPKLADGYHVLAFVLGDLGETDAAAQAARRAVELNPPLSKAQANLSLDRNSPARFRELVGNRVQRPEATPNDFLAHYHLGVAFRQKGLYVEALRELERAQAGGEDHGLVQQAMAEIHLLRGDAERAVAVYDALLERSSGSPKLWNERGVGLHQLGELSRAEESYRRALATDSTYALAWNNLGVARIYASSAEEAEDAFRRALEHRPELVDAWCNRGLLYARSGRQAEALDAYRAALRADPKAAAAWCGIGTVLREGRRLDEARTAFVRAVEAHPEYAEARYNLSFVLAQLGEYEAALRETKRALELNPYYTNPRFRLTIEVQFEEPELLAPELDSGATPRGGEEGVRNFHFSAPALDSLFRELAPSASAAPAVQEPPADPFSLARDFLTKGMLERAMVEARRAALAGADPVEAALFTGEIFARQGLHGEALERFDAALARLEPEEWSASHRQALLGRARSLFRLQRPSEAQVAARAIIERDAGDAEVLRLLGEALLEEGRAAAAVQVLEKLRRSAPTDPGLLRLLGRAHLLAGRTPEAEALLRQAVTIDPEAVSAQIELGRLLLEDGRYAGAADAARAALSVVPSFAAAALLLADALRRDAHAAEAVEHLVEFLAVDPYHPDALVLLGRTLLELDRPDDARHAFLRALRFERDSTQALYYLGVIAGQAREFREAVEWWRRCAEAEPEGELAQSARENIAAALRFARIFEVAPREAPAARSA